ncbi:hypothetical protein [Paenibacillus macquariensis]|uniref:Uncharacterized protein n=1 Tax=Paenibacillus macquariensis TaxID=948756 RepID=A0ABY1KDN2_9BACL|nr:hypothetical protein [Paenibacillus macquariensis]OAB27373.1 hypothetical protein PMSM_25510 [Paenibacillus macquariensis subsp. macquariensis]SIR66333.1 hypothetical protein SAMN05421578_12924 [Paenibacillus macquariensis]
MQTKNLHNDVKFELFENGLNFVVSALGYLNEPIQPSDLKYAILHLSSGIELILKERLRREHWTLLFNKLDKASYQDYNNGKFTSATFNECITRLIHICEVDISQQNKNHLNSLRDKRNRFEHFGIVDTSEALKATAADALNFLIDFINNELEDELDNDDMVVIREEVLKFDAFVHQRWKAIGDPLAKAFLVVTCPRCLQDAADLSDGLHCLFCGYKNDDPEDVANEYVSEVLRESKYAIVTQGGEWPIYSCPNCYSETLVRTDEVYICFQCSESWDPGDIKECMRCSRLCFAKEDDFFSLCNICLEDIRRQ